MFSKKITTVILLFAMILSFSFFTSGKIDLKKNDAKFWWGASALATEVSDSKVLSHAITGMGAVNSLIWVGVGVATGGTVPAVIGVAHIL